MMKFYTRLFLLFTVFTGTFYSVIAQDTTQLKINTTTITATQNDTPRTKYFKPASIIIPAAFVLYGSLKPVINNIQKWDDELFVSVKKNHAGFHTKADDYLMWAPSASIYLMDALSVPTKHSFKEHLLLDAGSLVVTGGIGYAMRKISGSIDEYKTHGTKFPSGHTANAFRGAEMVHQELKDSHKVLSYSGYVVATAVGAFRIYNKAHLLTEVLAGAGLGILSTKLTYWVFDRVKYKNKRK